MKLPHVARYTGSKLTSFSAALALTCSATLAQTIHVNDNGPGDPAPGNPFVSDPLEDGSAAHPFDEIQEGIDAGVDGGTVLVQDGTYFVISTLDLSSGMGATKALHIRSQNGAANTIIDASAINDQAMEAVSGETTQTILEGFTIQGGSANSTIFGEDRGGGLRMLESGLTIKSCIFRNNSATYGGGVYCDSGTLVIEDTEFTLNTGLSGGGGAYINRTNLQITGGKFEANTCTVHGGAIHSFKSLRSLTGTDFINNAAGGSGGAVWVTSDTANDALIDRCRFIGNEAGGGPGVQTWSQQHAVVTNSLFSGNESLGTGGGACMAGTNASLNVYNCTFANSLTASVGDSAFMGSMLVYNSILRTNNGNQVQGTNVVVSHCNVLGGYPGDKNIDADPMFKNQLGVDGIAGNTDDKLQLMPNSPCIDAGNTLVLATNFPAKTNPTDLKGVRRAQDIRTVTDTGTTCLGLAVDMGCFEVNAQCIQPIRSVRLP